MLRKVHTDQRPSLKQSTIISLMTIKFNSEECCHDSIFSEELTTKKQLYCIKFIYSFTPLMWVWLGYGYVN